MSPATPQQPLDNLLRQATLLCLRGAGGGLFLWWFALLSKDGLSSYEKDALGKQALAMIISAMVIFGSDNRAIAFSTQTQLSIRTKIELDLNILGLYFGVIGLLSVTVSTVLAGTLFGGLEVIGLGLAISGTTITSTALFLSNKLALSTIVLSILPNLIIAMTIFFWENEIGDHLVFLMALSYAIGPTIFGWKQRSSKLCISTVKNLYSKTAVFGPISFLQANLVWVSLPISVYAGAGNVDVAAIVVRLFAISLLFITVIGVTAGRRLAAILSAGKAIKKEMWLTVLRNIPLAIAFGLFGSFYVYYLFLSGGTVDFTSVGLAVAGLTFAVLLSHNGFVLLWGGEHRTFLTITLLSYASGIGVGVMIVPFYRIDPALIPIICLIFQYAASWYMVSYKAGK